MCFTRLAFDSQYRQMDLAVSELTKEQKRDFLQSGSEYQLCTSAGQQRFTRDDSLPSSPEYSSKAPHIPSLTSSSCCPAITPELRTFSSHLDPSTINTKIQSQNTPTGTSQLIIQHKSHVVKSISFRHTSHYVLQLGTIPIFCLDDLLIFLTVLHEMYTKVYKHTHFRLSPQTLCIFYTFTIQCLSSVLSYQW